MSLEWETKMTSFFYLYFHSVRRRLRLYDIRWGASMVFGRHALYMASMWAIFWRTSSTGRLHFVS